MFDDLRLSRYSAKANQGRYMNTIRRASFLFALALAAAQLTSCQNKAAFDPGLAGTFFPLHPGSTWTYRVVDKNLGTTNIITDRAMDKQLINTAKTGGEAVSEGSVSGGAPKSTILYVIEGGYINRISADGPTLIRFEEKRFLPQLLKPDLTWSNSLFPFGHLGAAFHIEQYHRTFLESGDVVVPAGRFPGCIRIETEAEYQRNSSHSVPSLRLRYIDWYAPNVGLVRTVVFKGGFFNSEVARVELLSFAKSPVEAAARSSQAASMPRVPVREKPAPFGTSRSVSQELH
jgi:hypothetical protein